jgi:hypothetical protein
MLLSWCQEWVSSLLFGGGPAQDTIVPSVMVLANHRYWPEVKHRPGGPFTNHGITPE